MNGLYQDYQQIDIEDDFGLFETDEFLRVMEDNTSSDDSTSTTSGNIDIDELFPMEFHQQQQQNLEYIANPIGESNNFITIPHQQYSQEEPMIVNNQYQAYNNYIPPQSQQVKPPPPSIVSQASQNLPKRSPSPSPPPPPLQSIKKKAIRVKRTQGRKRARPSKKRTTGRKRKREEESSDSGSDEEVRKRKNRESARASRERRKKYITDLEETNQVLSKSNSSLFDENKDLIGENDKLRLMLDEVMRNQQNNNHNNNNNSASTTGLQPLRKRRKLYLSEIHPATQALTVDPNANDSHLEALQEEENRKKKKRGSGRGRPIQNRMKNTIAENSKESGILPFRYVPFNFNPFSGQFWKTVVPTHHLTSELGKKAMFVFMIVLVLAVLLTIPNKDESVVNKYIADAQDSLRDIMPESINRDNNNNNHRRGGGMNMMSDEDEEDDFASRLAEVFTDFCGNLGELERKGEDTEFSMQDMFDLMKMRVDRDSNFLVMQVPNGNITGMDGLVEKPVIRKRKKKMTFKSLTKSLLYDICELIKEKEGI